MALTDKFLNFSSAQSLTQTGFSTNSIDQATARNLGAGENVFVRSIPLTATPVGTTPDVSIEIQAMLSRLSAPQTVTFTNATNKVNWTANTLADGDRVVFQCVGGTLAAGLSPNTIYYVKARAASDFEVALSPGGATVDITGDGTGTQSLLVFDGEIGSSGERLASTLVVGTGVGLQGTLPITFKLQGLDASTGQRYVHLRNIVRGATPTLSTAFISTAELVKDVDQSRAFYPSGFNIA